MILIGLACLGVLVLLRQSAPLHVPADATFVGENGTCGSAACWRRARYTMSATKAELAQFYTQQGYRCEEHTNRFYKAVSFSELQVPFWTCEKAREADRHIEIAFQQDVLREDAGITIHVYLFWEPEW